MTEKNIFLYKLFVSLNISISDFFYAKTGAPMKKVSLSFPLTLSKNGDPVKSLFQKFGRQLNPSNYSKIVNSGKMP